MPIQIKRAYDKVERSDGKRILVDRIWPRGISKEGALEHLEKRTKEHNKNITLVFGAKDVKHNQATVLKEILDHQ